MKYILLSLLILWLGIKAYAQNSARDSLARKVTQYIQDVNRAADVFLNTQLSDEERIRAIVPYTVIYDEGQIQRFKNVVESSRESNAIKAMALNKIYGDVIDDKKLFNQIYQWFSNPETPEVLRVETLNLIRQLTFVSIEDNLDIYQKMVEDPDLRFRAFAISRLVSYGDARVQRLLIRGLEDTLTALVNPTLAIELLSSSPKKEHYPAVYNVLLNTTDESARLAAVQSLGSYPEARDKLASISQDADEKEEFRTTALMALYSGDGDNITKYVAPILEEESAPVELKGLAIHILTNVRKPMSYRRKVKRADKYDQMIREIAEGESASHSEELRQVADRYIHLVKPDF